ncbi:MAG TPA: NUDIX domain-containing protein [Gammaproteobacteria bacterium]|jgi:ADP-ribose pyrophosphatase|nr:NUDIX domain-containing protein [Gammaproteobacteria bacterium]
MEDKIISFTQNDYEIVNREVLYQGFFRLVRNHLRHKKFDNSWTIEFSREIMERPSAVGVLPYDPVLDKVILIEQFRAGALANPESPWLIEIVAGIYRHPEKPIDVAQHEVEEESGLELLDLYPLYEYFVSPGGSNEHIILYLGRVNAANAGGNFGLAEENEDIRAFSLSLDEAVEMMREGKIKTAPAIITLQWLQLNREWLRQLWQTK